MPLPAIPKLVVFDVDGTLVDSQHNIVAAMQMAFEAVSLPVPPANAVRRVIGLPLEEAVAAAQPDLAFDKLQVAELYKDAFVTLRAQPDYREPMFPGAREALAALDAAGVLLGVATGKSRRGVESWLAHSGLPVRFVTRQTADDCPGKPNPDMLLRALAETGAEAAETVMVGDTTFDMLMAKNAKIAAVGVEWGYHAPEELTETGARAVAADFMHLIDILMHSGRNTSCAHAIS